eukprot:5905795-Pyramimonas_sp.AAC.1
MKAGLLLSWCNLVAHRWVMDPRVGVDWNFEGGRSRGLLKRTVYVYEAGSVWDATLWVGVVIAMDVRAGRNMDTSAFYKKYISCGQGKGTDTTDGVELEE